MKKQKSEGFSIGNYAKKRSRADRWLILHSKITVIFRFVGYCKILNN